jgi:hypothetical protein
LKKLKLIVVCPLLFVDGLVTVVGSPLNFIDGLGTGNRGKIAENGAIVESFFLPMAGAKLLNSAKLTSLYGRVELPGSYGIKDFEYVSFGVVKGNPTLQIPSIKNPLVLQKGKEYIWLMDKSGTLRVGEEVLTGGKLLDGSPAKLGHPTLVGGDAARIGGELRWVESEKSWKINNESGRYTKSQTDRTTDMLRNVQKSFSNNGTKVNINYGPF